MIYSLPLDESCPCFKFKRLLPSPRPPPFHAISIHSTNQLNEMGLGGGGSGPGQMVSIKPITNTFKHTFNEA